MKRLFLALPFCCAIGVHSHPHMFIDARISAAFSGGFLTGLDVTWFFDPFFSAMIVEDFDRDRNGRFCSIEVADIRENAFSNLANFNWFTFVRSGNETFSPERVENFAVSLAGDTLVYSFHAPMRVPVRNGRISIGMYDPSFFCDVRYHPVSPVTLSGPDAGTGRWSVSEDRDTGISYEGDVSVSRPDQTYTGVAYPQRVVVTFD